MVYRFPMRSVVRGVIALLLVGSQVAFAGDPQPRNSSTEGNITRGFGPNYGGQSSSSIITQGYQWRPQYNVPINPGPSMLPNYGPNNQRGFVPQADTSYIDPTSAWYRRLHYQDFGPYSNGWQGYVVNQYAWDGYPPPVFFMPVNRSMTSMRPQTDDTTTALRPDWPDDKAVAQNAREHKRIPKKKASLLKPVKRQEFMLNGTQEFTKGRYKQAASKFRTVVLADPGNVDARLAYAVAQFATRNYDVAGQAIIQALKDIPDLARWEFNLRGRYGSDKELREQLVALEQHVQKRHVNDGNDLLLLGFVQHFSGQPELAAETFRRLSSSQPQSDAGVAADLFLEANMPVVETQPAEASASKGK